MTDEALKQEPGFVQDIIARFGYKVVLLILILIFLAFVAFKFYGGGDSGKTVILITIFILIALFFYQKEQGVFGIPDIDEAKVIARKYLENAVLRGDVAPSGKPLRECEITNLYLEGSIQNVENTPRFYTFGFDVDQVYHYMVKVNIEPKLFKLVEFAYYPLRFRGTEQERVVYKEGQLLKSWKKYGKGFPNIFK